MADKKQPQTQNLNRGSSFDMLLNHTQQHFQGKALDEVLRDRQDLSSQGSVIEDRLWGSFANPEKE